MQCVHAGALSLVMPAELDKQHDTRWIFKCSATHCKLVAKIPLSCGYMLFLATVGTKGHVSADAEDQGTLVHAVVPRAAHQLGRA